MVDKKQNINAEKNGKRVNKLLISLSIFIGSLAVLALVLALILIPVLNNFAKRIGGTNFKDFVKLYKEVTSYCSEESVVDYPYNATTDFNSAKNKLEEKGINVFKDGIINPDLVSGPVSYDSIELADKELAALLNNIVSNYVEELNIPIYKELDLRLSVRQIEIKETDYPGKYILNMVGKINTEELSSKIGIIGGLLPKDIYLTASGTYYFNAEIDKWCFEKNSLKLNQIKDESFKQLLKILSTYLEGTIEDIDVNDLNDVVAGLICDGLNGFCNLNECKIELSQNKIKIINMRD